MVDGGDSAREEGAATLLRATYLLGRELLGPLAGVSSRAAAGPAAGDGAAVEAHHVHRLRVLLTTLTSWLEGQDPSWLATVRAADVELHRAQLAELSTAAAGRSAGLERLLASDQARIGDALREADRLTFRRREVDLFGASMLTGRTRSALRGAIDRGELAAAEDDGQGPRITLAELARYAAASGAVWDDGLGDPSDGQRHESRLRALLSGRR